AYFEPYRQWVNSDDKKKLDAGGEQIDGKWLTSSEVDALNAKHSTFDKPWELSDEVHVIRTNLSYRETKQVFLLVSAYRTFFLKKFGEEWQLKIDPATKLEVVVTAKQEQFTQQIIAHGFNPGQR